MVKECECGCGGEIIVKPHHKRFGLPRFLPSHYSKVKTPEHRKKLSDTIKKLYDTKRPRGMGFPKGIIPANAKYKDGRNIYRKIAFNHYGKKCQKCGVDDMRVLTVHHKDRNRKNNNIENLEVLCYNCHYLNHSKKFKK